ncbi:PREDICTED: uncharacterized protein LOC104802065 isoform X2 [Tarenaya hassleriana]|uniref:uncharacterized protein LOC104802065 isoform X2 n=1 Tax=Tarenaya hassleriana TaxID=28532 RepID=UPI00053C411C|nr:PREDICTED: uncharacterized protein LOC104802065 isoform X2 [Tarenaya hassleriana]
MGEHEGWAASPPPSGVLPNGLLPGKAASVIRPLDAERWAKAEERTAELIACIQPNPPSEDRRNAVARYVQRLIMECFPHQVEVFTFGSVPLKTYLPDGDIDLSAFSRNQNLKDSWAHVVRDMLEKEEKNENAEFCVKEVQYIQAEVKIIKCLVENIVVDISFNQLGGLCTLCFLEEVDHYINQNHLFKRSIILIKAWCYYESRILGAHHGLISTYALETLVLYIFHVFNNSFAGPLEVLYRFLEFFSKFDWENFCVSLWGPVPISSLPNVTAEPPRKNGGELQVSEVFLKACSRVYAVYPATQENQGQPFVSKHFNVIDPLRENNNLGRSVSKGNFFRIRSAFAFGAKKLARFLDCPKDGLFHEIDHFFMNTWERHGSGHRPDAPGDGLWQLRLSDPDLRHRAEKFGNSSGSKRNENSLCHEINIDGVRGTPSFPSQQNKYKAESKSRGSDTNSSKVSDHHGHEVTTSQSVSNDKFQRSFKPESMVNNFQGRHLFSRTRSSPELTEIYGETPVPSRLYRAPEPGKCQTDSSRVENIRKKNESETSSSHGRSFADSSSVRHTSSHQSLDSTAETNSAVTNYQDDLGSGSMKKNSPVPGAQGMQQEEQDLINLMSSAAYGFNGQFPFPLNFAGGHLPFPIAPSVLASMGYGQRNLAGIVPANLPFNETAWGANMQFQQSLVFSPSSHYFPGGFPPYMENSGEAGNDTMGSVEINIGEPEHDLRLEQERGTSSFDLKTGGYGMHQANDKEHSSTEDYSYEITGRRFSETWSVREDDSDNSHYPARAGNQMPTDERTTGSRSVSRASSVRSKTSSESSWDGSTTRGSKPVREKRNRKVLSPGPPSALSGKGKGVPEHSIQVDNDNREWVPVSSSEMPERDIGPQPTAVQWQVQRHQMQGLEPAQTSGSESIIPFAPLYIGHGLQQKTVDNSGYTFYPTGPPVPIVAMFPVYNFQAGNATSDASTSHCNVDEATENSDSSKSFDSYRGLDQSELITSSQPSKIAASVEPMQQKPDILNGDFVSHWQNLQYGRLCQNSQSPPLLYSAPVVVPPAYLQGRMPWDGPGRPLAYTNVANQLMTYGPRLVPVAPLQSASTRPANVYPRYADEMPRYRSGTGTYFPNPISNRERHSSSMRRGNYGHDRNTHHGDRDGNWNVAKMRGSGRGHNRSQAEKANSRQDRSDRHWGSYRHESSSYHSQNGPTRATTTSQEGSANMAYSMYRMPGMKQSGAAFEGHSTPPVVMFYPYDHNTVYNATAEQLEFGSLGPMGFSSNTNEDPRFLGASSAQMASPEQPSSPNLPRGS